MFELKRLSMEAIPGALAKAERYRLLHEPMQAESICRDILAADPSNGPALVMLLLSLTDQFGQGINAQDALKIVARLSDEYERAYYSGIVHERRALALFRQGDFRAGQPIHALLQVAMQWYETAQALRPAGNDDSLLRWNACARFLTRNAYLCPEREIGECVLSE
ncbi:MAG TPA: hypothetical protein VE959_33260 [Bryobacteraceae bacterium]|nr:hypothetical protein [Bryobacteraceae bacterium]